MEGGGLRDEVGGRRGEVGGRIPDVNPAIGTRRCRLWKPTFSLAAPVLNDARTACIVLFMRFGWL